MKEIGKDDNRRVHPKNSVNLRNAHCKLYGMIIKGRLRERSEVQDRIQPDPCVPFN